MVSDRPARAVLFVPGDRPDRFGKAVQSGADAVIIDLEDAVAPVQAAFLPTATEIAWARRVIEADDGAATQVDGAMVDKPVVARANRILAEQEMHREVS